MSGSEPDFRGFALALYEHDGVSAAALLVQNRCGADVNVLLLAAFVGAVRGCAFREADAAAAQHRVGGWQRDVVAPLRAVRIRLKTGPSPAPSAATAAIRDRVKTVELDAEMIELAELGLFVDDRELSPVRDSPVAAAVAAMTAVTRGDRTVEVQEAVSVIATAAAEYGVTR